MIYGILYSLQSCLQLLIIDHRTQFALLLYEELPYEPLEMFQNRNLMKGTCIVAFFVSIVKSTHSIWLRPFFESANQYQK